MWWTLSVTNPAGDAGAGGRRLLEGFRMKSRSLAVRVARTAAAAVLAAFGFGAAQVAVGASVASASSGAGWIRLAHLSPNSAPVDVYLYSFGNPNAQIVLDHVGYGTVSPYEQVAAGEYTVAMRAAGAPSSSSPVLSTAVNIAAGHAYTVAGLGPAAGLRLVVIPDELTTPPGKALVRVIQASMHRVTITAGSTTLAARLKFATVTSYSTVNPGTWSIRAHGGGESVMTSITLAAGTIHTLVVLDEPSGLGLVALLDAAGSKVAPAGGPRTGFGGTAAHPGAALVPWAAAVLGGLAVTVTGTAIVTRRRRPALHAR
jgi:hypothetical protein